MTRVRTENKLRDSQEALVCGEAFQRQADELIFDIRKVREGSHHVMPDELGNVVVCATNLAFAAELYLKGLLIQLGQDVPMSHNLQKLYGAIDQPVRLLIESVYNKALPGEIQRLGGLVSFMFAKGPLEQPRWNEYKVSKNLPDLLARSKDLFISWRYVFESSLPEGSSYDFHQFEYGLLRCATEVLRVELAVRLHETGDRPLPEQLLSE
jgi:hypothetical protein